MDNILKGILTNDICIMLLAYVTYNLNASLEQYASNR